MCNGFVHFVGIWVLAICQLLLICRTRQGNSQYDIQITVIATASKTTTRFRSKTCMLHIWFPETSRSTNWYAYILEVPWTHSSFNVNNNSHNEISICIHVYWKCLELHNNRNAEVQIQPRWLSDTINLHITNILHLHQIYLNLHSSLF